MNSSESGNERDWDMAINPTPKTHAAAGMIRSIPAADFRDARKKAPATAPTPVAPMRNPSVCGPPCRISFAKTGMRTAYDMPRRLTRARSIRMERIGTNPYA